MIITDLASTASTASNASESHSSASSDPTGRNQLTSISSLIIISADGLSAVRHTETVKTQHQKQHPRHRLRRHTQQKIQLLLEGSSTSNNFNNNETIETESSPDNENNKSINNSTADDDDDDELDEDDLPILGLQGKEPARQQPPRRHLLWNPSHKRGYEMSLISLRFLEDMTENRYIYDQYIKHGYLGSTFFPLFYALGAIIVIYLIMLKGDSTLWQHTGMYIFGLGSIIMFVLLTVAHVYSLRHHHTSFDYVFALAEAFGLIAVLIAREWTLEREEDPLVDVLGHTFLTLMLARMRVRAFLLCVAPTALVIGTFLGIYYGPIYSTWVLLGVFPVVVAYILDLEARAQFVHVDRSERRLARIAQHTQLMEQTLLAAFPGTAMRQLATRRSKTATLRYSHTALVVTDASGFTAWTTRTSPLDVIHTLSRMFRELDAAAVSWGVEKVCTVGDSYVGAVFGPCQQQHGDDKDGGSTLSADQNSSDREDGDSSVAARRALTGLQFAFDVVRLPQRIGLPLRSRVGVHVGTVYAGFVGFSPPVFDVFGAAVTEAKALEGSGAPSRVHVSRVALSLCESNGLGSGVDAVATARGTLLRGWEAAEPDGVDDRRTSQTSVGSASATSLMSLVRQARHSSNVQNGHRRSDSLQDSSIATRGTASYRAKSSDASSDVCGAPDIAAALRHRRDEEITKSWSLPFGSSSDEDELQCARSWFRTFVDADMERRYLQHIQREAPYEYAMCLICFFLGLTSAIYYMTYSCSDTATDRWIVCVFLFTMMGYYLTLHTPRLSGVARLVIGTLCFDVCSVYAFYSQDCVLSYERAVAMRNVYLIPAMARYLIPLVAFSLPLWMRSLSLFFILASAHIFEPMIREAIQEKVGVTISIAAILPVSTMVISAFAIDEVLRRGFIARVRVADALKTSGTYAKNTRATLEMMLPAHAADVVLQRAAERVLADARSDGSSSHQGSDADDEHQQSLVWEHTSLIVAFISFDIIGTNHFSRLDRHPEWATSILNDMERIALSHGVVKVKTTGTTMLLVSGVDPTAMDVSEAARRMCAAVLTIVRGTSYTHHFLHDDDVDGQNSDDGGAGHRVDVRGGVHAGACFGAVLGTRGLTFDVFGDTVNTASRVMSTSPAGRVRVSPVAVDCLGGCCGAPLGSQLRESGCVEMKGKGTMQVYDLESV
eukprot:PhM_4_TR9517/c2_g3_i18/m.98322